MATLTLSPLPPDEPDHSVDYHGDHALVVPYGTPGVRTVDQFRPLVPRLLAHLYRDLADLTVDEIDGECYWRCCMFHRSILLTFARANIEAVPVPDLTYDSAGMLAYLRVQAYRGQASLAALAQAAEFFPYPVFRRLMNDQRVPMRAPLVTRDAHAGKAFRYLVRVTSGAWRGADVEAALWDAVVEVERTGEERFRSRPGGSELVYTGARVDPPVPEPRSGGQHPDDPTAVHVGMDVEFRLVTEEPAEDDEASWTRQVPYVEARIYLPLPPEGVLARQYDAVVRDQQRWHLQLPGATSTQDKEVALRTWALGLLIRDRHSFGAAMRTVHEVTGLAEVSQACFTGDRKRLLERVPEARFYLYARRGADRTIAKGVSAADPLQP